MQVMSSRAAAGIVPVAFDLEVRPRLLQQALRARRFASVRLTPFVDGPLFLSRSGRISVHGEGAHGPRGIADRRE